MAINFDTLPQENPFKIPDDIYMAKIVEAAMKQGKDPNKKPYLNLKYDLFGADGRKVGSIYDIIAESDASAVQYKTGRFVRACGIPLVGSMELHDIQKLVLNKSLVVDIQTGPKTERDPNPKPQVALFNREAYYTVDEFREVWLLAHPNESFDINQGLTDTEDTEVPFNPDEKPAADTQY